MNGLSPSYDTDRCSSYIIKEYLKLNRKVSFEKILRKCRKYHYLKYKCFKPFKLTKPASKFYLSMPNISSYGNSSELFRLALTIDQSLSKVNTGLPKFTLLYTQRLNRYFRLVYRDHLLLFNINIFPYGPYVYNPVISFFNWSHIAVSLLFTKERPLNTLFDTMLQHSSQKLYIKLGCLLRETNDKIKYSAYFAIHSIHNSIHYCFNIINFQINQKIFIIMRVLLQRTRYLLYSNAYIQFFMNAILGAEIGLIPFNNSPYSYTKLALRYLRCPDFISQAIDTPWFFALSLDMVYKRLLMFISLYYTQINIMHPIVLVSYGYGITLYQKPRALVNTSNIATVLNKYLDTMGTLPTGIALHENATDPIKVDCIIALKLWTLSSTGFNFYPNANPSLSCRASWNRINLNN